MTLDEAIQHCEEVMMENLEKTKDRNASDPIAINCGECAEEHHQLAEWLKELKAYRDARAEIAEALNDDTRGEQNDYERGRKSGIFLCESIISVKLGESRSENPNKSEIPNTCGDAISRQAVIDVTWEEPSYTEALNVLTEVRDKVKVLPSVTPQQKTGRWIKQNYGWNWQCSECGFVTPPSAKEIFTFCPKCGCKMQEVKE